MVGHKAPQCYAPPLCNQKHAHWKNTLATYKKTNTAERTPCMYHKEPLSGPVHTHAPWSWLGREELATDYTRAEPIATQAWHAHSIRQRRQAATGARLTFRLCAQAGGNTRNSLSHSNITGLHDWPPRPLHPATPAGPTPNRPSAVQNAHAACSPNPTHAARARPRIGICFQANHISYVGELPMLSSIMLLCNHKRSSGETSRMLKRFVQTMMGVP